MSTLGSRIRDLRELNDMSQKEFAKKLNISNSTLSQYESDVRIPSDEIKIKISNYFNVSLDYLMGKSNIKNPSNGEYSDLDELPEGVELLRRAKGKLSPESYKKMIEIANIFVDSVDNEDKEKKNNM